MKKSVAISLLVLSLAGMFLTGSWYGRPVDQAGSTGGRKVLYYVDPMNPSHTSDKPGFAPCGMPMEPVYADEGEAAGGKPAAPGAVKITPQKQQLLGVKVSPVEETAGTHTLRTIGRVAPDEKRVHRLIAGAPGYITDVSEATTDTYVKKDELLATFSSPDSIPSIQSYILTLNTMDNMRQSNSERWAESLEGGSTYLLRAEKLLDLGMSRLQIEELRETRAVPRKIKILSPVDGFVLERNVWPDQKFERGAEWYRIADLSRVWIVTDIFDQEARYIQPGMKARVSLPQQDKVFDATVTHVPPRFDASARTLRVRLETDNPENELRPDMFVDVELLIPLPPAITVSADAVLDSGIRKTVFVDLGEGRFEPREVETGWRLGDRVQILEGLTPGERIVTSGIFLIDSESRMKLAAAGFYGDIDRDPVCNMNVDRESAAAAGLKSEYAGKVYYFCASECKLEFDTNPDRYLAGAGKHQANAAGESTANPHPYVHTQAAAHQDQQSSRKPEANPAPKEIVRDPVCGMHTREEFAKAQWSSSEYQGKTWFFCSNECKSEFDKDPGRYVKK